MFEQNINKVTIEDLNNMKIKVVLMITAILVYAICSEAQVKGSIKDKQDGKLSKTVKIGTQNWCTKNLDVSTYRNGDSIPQVKDAAKWKKLTTGAWCYYENKTINGTVYGKLYNWYAVIDPRGLAPIGYHIPSDAEWTILVNYLGGDTVAGVKMKSTTGWEEYWGKNCNGTNTSGFTGLAGGCRSNGTGGTLYICFGGGGYWWSTTPNLYNSAWLRSITHLYNDVERHSHDKRNGVSVRCIAD